MAMETGIDEAELSERVDALLTSGRLPSIEPSDIWAGSGRDAQCSVCQLSVRRGELAFDLSFRTPGGEVELHMHSRCRTAWERALRHRVPD